MEQFEILREAVAQVEQQLELDKITVERAVFGLFFSGVKLSTGHGGLCFTPVKEMPEAVCCPSSARAMPLSGRLRGRPVREYLDDIFGENILRRTLGIAALNALSVAAWEQSPPQDYEILMGVDAFDELDAARYPKTVVVGALVPMLKKLMAAGADFHVLEQAPRTLKEREMPYYLPPERAAECVPEADLLVITGPTASMLPEAFFARGVTMLGGIQVTKPDELLNIISEGGSGYHFFGRYAERTVIRKKR